MAIIDIKIIVLQGKKEIIILWNKEIEPNGLINTQEVKTHMEIGFVLQLDLNICLFLLTSSFHGNAGCLTSFWLCSEEMCIKADCTNIYLTYNQTIL